MSFGGGGSSGSQQSTSGFKDLPPEIQNAFKDLAVQAQGYLPGNNASTVGMFTPQQSALTTQANNTIGQGFAPTAQQYQNSIDMQMNPFNSSVINEINRQAQGQNSVLQQNLNAAGQFGSNRSFLGANDIDLSRQNQIGSFLQNQYNTASQNALTTIPQLQAQSAQAQLQAGQAQQAFGSQVQQAPIQSLAAIAQILGVLPTNSSQSSGSNSGSQFSFGLGGLF